MTKQCARCFEYRPVNSFTTGKAQCKPCRAEVSQLRRLEKRGKPLPTPIHLVPYVNYLRILYRAYTGVAPVELPVKSNGHIKPFPHACMIQRVDGRDWIYIASHRGTRQLLFDTVGPFELINNLRALGLEVILPTERLING